MSTEHKNDILLESGTNEMGIMEFTISGNAFGINVEKVKEIMMPCPIKAIPHSHPAVEGVIKPRQQVMTVVDLPAYLGLKPSESDERNLFIITSFNKLNVAFRVHTVEGIDRISWSNIQKMDRVVYEGDSGVATGLAECNGRLITILDFERIVSDISPDTGIQVSEIDTLGERNVTFHHVVLAEDSPMLASLICECLQKAGYVNITKFDNGEEAWNYVSRFKDEPDVLEQISLIITDIEMPRMDGHRFTKLVKSDKNLMRIPVVIFSSLINEQMMLKGQEVGADAQMTKPEIANLVTVIDSLIGKNAK